ncbi:MAG TPA: ABC-F family ATP-binding cassette domain-containing protein [Candidatus Paceibacterota bacterium]|nr:ABC-F family ATP-binding cassette domain-containing protein [Candidatus Paceibacterota bacterium]HMP18924.1 ABC-F family ATP-binding cassette domain-containing protein [Candidatus Paceibacterota bacterium]HMP85087.1 ABC-F family ATP-binding cassette domain-containing protein [Candidatus Paceibacterota bacterium]
MLKVKNITKYYGNKKILNKISFNLERANKVALVGYNGTGKTTLLKMLAGIEKPDSGNIEIHKNCVLGFVPQDTEQFNSLNVFDYIKKTALSEKIINQKQQDVFDRNIEIMFSGFALSSETKFKKIGDLSSGQKTKVFLTAVLLKNPDLMLLDEPTNNLDLPALIWLEDFLKKTDSAFIIVSHDKKFLNNVCNKIFEIDWKERTIQITNSKYLDYLINKAKEQSRQLQMHILQKEERQRLRNLAETKQEQAEKGAKHQAKDNDRLLRGYYRDKAADSFHDAKIIYRRIKRMEEIKKPNLRGEFKIKIDPEISPLDLNISINDLICGYNDDKGDFSIGPINLQINFGEKICILGLNGSGKTTFLKTFTEVIPKISGEMKIGSGVKIGNLMQEHESLPKKETLIGFMMKRVFSIDELGQKIPTERSLLQNKLLHFGFDEDQVKNKISEISPGGRARLLLAYFSAMNVNTLILDEPTNHLDMEAQEALDQALSEFNGTIIVVTHDRFFVENYKHDFLYLIDGGIMSAVVDFKKYVDEMEKRARKLLRMIK